MQNVPRVKRREEDNYIIITREINMKLARVNKSASTSLNHTMQLSIRSIPAEVNPDRWKLPSGNFLGCN